MSYATLKIGEMGAKTMLPCGWRKERGDTIRRLQSVKVQDDE